MKSSKTEVKFTPKGSNTALLVIDVQQGLFKRSTPIYKAEELLTNINTLVERAHDTGIPVVYVQHSNEKILLYGSQDWKIHPELHPLETDVLIHKRHGNAFEETALKDELEAKQVGKLVVTGLVTQGCVKATCQGAKELGYEVVLAQDAHSNYSKQAATVIEEWNQKLTEDTVELKSTGEIVFD